MNITHAKTLTHDIDLPVDTAIDRATRLRTTQVVADGTERAVNTATLALTAATILVIRQVCATPFPDALEAAARLPWGNTP